MKDNSPTQCTTAKNNRVVIAIYII